MLFTLTFAVTLIQSVIVNVAILVTHVLDKQTTRCCRETSGSLGSDGFDQWCIIQLLGSY